MDIIAGLESLINPTVLLFMVIGVFAGIIIGALPGLTDPMALGLAIPLTFGMEPLQAILFLLGIHFGALYGGSITAILINTPGTPAAAAVAIDGYPLTLKGESKRALQMSAFSAFIAGLISVSALVIFAPVLSKVALKFGPTEYFALGLLGLSVVAGVAGKSLSKAFFAAAIGLFIALIGTDPLIGAKRFTFGSYILEDGVNLIAALIGLFAVSEILNQLQQRKNGYKQKSIVLSGKGISWKDIKGSITTIFKGGAIGSFLGALPGTGAVISSFVSYNEAVRSSKKPEEFGKGKLKGVAAAESGAVGTESAAMIPLMTFGIPGDVSTAIILGAFILHGIQVGPQLFVTSGDLVSGLFIGIIILELLVLAFGWFGANWFSKVVKIPRNYLFSVITVLVISGTFGIINNMFNVWVALFFGFLGFAMKRFEYPIPPLLLGIILGPIIEQNFLRAMSSSGGDFTIFVTRPATLLIFLIAIVSIIVSIRMQRRIERTS